MRLAVGSELEVDSWTVYDYNYYKGSITNDLSLYTRQTFRLDMTHKNRSRKVTSPQGMIVWRFTSCAPLPAPADTP